MDANQSILLPATNTTTTTTATNNTITLRQAGQADAIALLVNENAMDDLRIFLETLQLWNTTLPTLYIASSKPLELKYKGTVHTKVCLEMYTNLTRQQMERLPSKQGMSNLFHDFTVEKCSLMEWAIQEHGSGVLFCDADICWLGPLPPIDPTTITLSRHEIRLQDEARFGTFNAGFLYIPSLQYVNQWRKACLTSTFFEQKALDIFADSCNRFGTHVNYGWWRMYQGPTTAEDRQAEWSIHRHESHSGLCVKGTPVICIHTHWKTNDHITTTFNKWILSRLELLKKQKKVTQLLKIVGPNHSRH